ncbi:hypothetical protein B0H16DRAFT_1524112 [Mycena metata]|uniref:F-box domain-containing protein n=1 Tax=Mycena metata TaxID=1033252 RepID=A0AAD7JLD3_9AGAR|nr:hypothetical protein B0H16DRAFT_1524112 [Mycena metata]
MEKHIHYPVLTLPIEIVVGIFQAFLPDYPNCPPLLGLESPTVLTQICREWREIALAAPTLWRAILFHLDTSSAEKQLVVAHSWLLRSRPLPLSLSLRRIDRVRSPGIAPATAIMLPLTIVPHCDRWEYIYMGNGIPDNISTLDCPILRHLEMSWTPSAVTALTLSTPLLSSVALDYGSTRYVDLPYAQLTTLRLTGMTFPHESAPLLRRTSSLVHCELSALSYTDIVGYTAPVQEVTLPRLESLTLRIRLLDGHPMEPSLAVPALKRLHIVASIRLSDQDAVSSLGAFLEKAGCARLEEVCITTASKPLVYRHPDEVALEDAFRTAFPSIPTFIFVLQ